MKEQNYTTSILVNATAKEAFKSINSVSKWWTENLEGNCQKLDDEFMVRFSDVHVSTQKLIEMIPDSKIVWLVTDSKLNFIEDQSEWTNTRISFEISEQGSTQSLIRFTHWGLVPEMECYDACSNAWSQYLHSLLSLITTGKGQPGQK